MTKADIKRITVKKASKSESKIEIGKAVFRSDAKQTATLIKVGKSSAANAIRASKALGLPITFMQNGKLYREQPNGTKEIVSETNTEDPTVLLKKGMIFHAKK